MLPAVFVSATYFPFLKSFPPSKLIEVDSTYPPSKFPEYIFATNSKPVRCCALRPYNSILIQFNYNYLKNLPHLA